MSNPTLHHRVAKAIADQPVTDLHTHVFAPCFGASPTPGGLLLWGIDELVTYHYLVAEVFRVVPASELPYDRFWAMSKAEQADHIWKWLFVERTPVSEACRGVLTTLKLLGLDPGEKSLDGYRKWFAAQEPDRFVDLVMRTANVDCITMTNEVFSDPERGLWERGEVREDPRFRAVLRIDKLVCDFKGACEVLRAGGFAVAPDLSGRTIAEVQRFLRQWLVRMNAVYVATSLPPEFVYPAGEGDPGTRVIREALLPVLAEVGKVWAMMIGSRRGVNPALRDAADMGGRADVTSVTNLCREFPQNRFMVTMLSRENQHELCVAARKFGNLLPFGCWWFLNNPSLIEEMTTMRFELLGTSFAPQHSDARILDQLIYKWSHSRAIIADVLARQYGAVEAAGRPVSDDEMRRDARLLLRDNYRKFVGV